MTKCIIMDFENGEVRVIGLADNLDCEEIEEILTESYEYSLDSIEYMVVKDLKLIID